MAAPQPTVTITMADGTTTTALLPPLTAAWLAESASRFSPHVARALTPAEIAALELVAAHQRAELREQPDPRR